MHLCSSQRFLCSVRRIRDAPRAVLGAATTSHCGRTASGSALVAASIRSARFPSSALLTVASLLGPFVPLVETKTLRSAARRKQESASQSRRAGEGQHSMRLRPNARISRPLRPHQPPTRPSLRDPQTQAAAARRRHSERRAGARDQGTKIVAAAKLHRSDARVNARAPLVLLRILARARWTSGGGRGRSSHRRPGGPARAAEATGEQTRRTRLANAVAEDRSKRKGCAHRAQMDHRAGRLPTRSALRAAPARAPRGRGRERGDGRREREKSWAGEGGGERVGDGR